MIFKINTARYVTSDNIIFNTELVIIALAGTFRKFKSTPLANKHDQTIFRCGPYAFLNARNRSPTHFVPNICHQHQRSRPYLYWIVQSSAKHWQYFGCLKFEKTANVWTANVSPRTVFLFLRIWTCRRWCEYDCTFVFIYFDPQESIKQGALDQDRNIQNGP